MAIRKRQFITDTAGNRIGVILPLEEYALVEGILEKETKVTSEAEKLKQIEHASSDPLFMADLRDALSDFAEVDAEWWESKE